MVVTKEPQIIDAQNGATAKVYFKILNETKDHTNNTRVIIFATLVKDVVPSGEPVQYSQFGKDQFAVFKEATYMALFGDMKISEFEAVKYQLLIDQIGYINSYEWTGKEIQKPVRFWSLTSNDLELV